MNRRNRRGLDRRMAASILESVKMGGKMEKGCRFGRMGRNWKVNGRMIVRMGMVCLYMLMGMFMKGNGSMGKPMDRGNLQRLLG